MKLKTILIACGIALALTIALKPASAQEGNGGIRSAADKRVTLKVDGADLRFALKLLFESAGANYTLDPAVQGSVTVALQDVPFRTALESLLRSTESAAPLTYRIEDGVYQIGLRQGLPPDQGEIGGPIDLGQKPVAPPAKKVGKINLNFADVRDIIAAFGGTMIESRSSQLGNGGGFGNGFGGFGNMGGFGGMGGFGAQGFSPMGGFMGNGNNVMMGPFGGGFGNMGGGFGNMGGGFGNGFGGGFRRF